MGMKVTNYGSDKLKKVMSTKSWIHNILYVKTNIIMQPNYSLEENTHLPYSSFYINIERSCYGTWFVSTKNKIKPATGNLKNVNI